MTRGTIVHTTRFMAHTPPKTHLPATSTHASYFHPCSSLSAFASGASPGATVATPSPSETFLQLRKLYVELQRHGDAGPRALTSAPLATSSRVVCMSPYPAA